MSKKLAIVSVQKETKKQRNKETKKQRNKETKEQQGPLLLLLTECASKTLSMPFGAS
jgi:hypothetical protein